MSEEFSLEDRIPCPDDNCIGIIGDNGKCGVCGRVYENADFETKTESPAKDIEETDNKPSETELKLDLDERICCPDEMCVGIIGTDNKCGTCGKSI